MKSRIIACLSALFLLLVPGPAYAATGSVDDPAGDVDLGGDISSFTVHNNARALKFVVAFANDSGAEPTHYLITMKWGATAKKRCSFDLDTGAVPDCHNDSPTGAPPSSCGSFTLADDGSKMVAKLPRSCIKKAADTMKFKVVATYEGPCIGCGGAPMVRKDATAWTPMIKRG